MVSIAAKISSTIPKPRKKRSRPTSRERRNRCATTAQPGMSAKTFQGIKGAITVTEDGLLAAAHRRGAEDVKRYLEHKATHGWSADVTDTADKRDVPIFTAIENAPSGIPGCPALSLIGILLPQCRVVCSVGAGTPIEETGNGEIDPCASITVRQFSWPAPWGWRL